MIHPIYDGLDSLYFQWNSNFSSDCTQASLSTFFIGPKLPIDYDETQNPRLFCPSQRYVIPNGNIFERRYVRILVRNTGFVKATNCEAKMRIISSNYIKQLIWDRAITSGVLQELSLHKNIRARRREELVHVVFSDSRFTNDIIQGPIYASASTSESLMDRNMLILADGFGLENFDIEIAVLCEEGAFCKSVSVWSVQTPIIDN